MFEACGSYQWAREFLKNSLEAKATRVEFGIEWQAVAAKGVYRRTIIDDGAGMNAQELKAFFATLGAGAKKIGGIHDNFGVGAKIASLPWNPQGVIVISYQAGRASMIWIMLDSDSGDYELVEFTTGEEKSVVVDPSVIDWSATDEKVDYAAIKPAWLTDHGTVIVLLGSDEYPDTVLGNPAAGEAQIKGLSVYLNSRFWDLADVDVKVAELRSEKKNSWPSGPDDRDNARRPNNRTIHGARHFLADVKGEKGKLGHSDIVYVDDDRVGVEWYLWEGERPHVDSYAKRSGYIAVRYNGELFELTAHKSHFRWFGVIEGAVQQNLTLILEPQHYMPGDGRWGVHPDQSRGRLIFTGNGQKGVALPLADWGAEFAERMPEPILDAIKAARGEFAGKIEDEEYRKRLQDKFGSRWTMKVMVKARRKVEKPITVRESGPEYMAPEDVPGIENPSPEPPNPSRRRRKKTVMVVRKRAQLGEGEEGVEREVKVDVPRYRFAPSDNFDKPFHLAQWAPNDPEGPCVVINRDAPVLIEAVRHHQDMYPDHLAEQVDDTVRRVFGEIAACKIAHSQKLVSEVTQEELDDFYRNEMALTISLMGLLAEESLIAQRLGFLGRTKKDKALSA